MAHGRPDDAILEGLTAHGDLVWFDGFEVDTPRYDKIIEGTGAAAARSTDRAHHGAASYKFTGGSDGLREAGLVGMEPACARTNVGVQTVFNLPGPIETFWCALYLFDGASVWNFELKWIHDTQSLVYVDAAQADVVIAAGLVVDEDPAPWNLIKVVADLRTKKYVGAIFNDLSYDLSGIDGWIDADAGMPKVEWFIGADSHAGSNEVAYADCLIVSKNEPA